jgi:osmotically-inducible protein OsmY
VAFDYTAPQGAQITQSLEKRWQKIAVRDKELANVQIACEGSEVILRGQVKTAEQFRLAEALARLEPGVHAVRNELVITEPEPSPDPAAQ